MHTHTQINNEQSKHNNYYNNAWLWFNIKEKNPLHYFTNIKFIV